MNITKINFSILTLLLLCFFPAVLKAQLKNEPVWKITSNKPEVKVGDVIEISLTSVIEKDWYMYSNDMDPNLGPIAAEFTWKKDASYALVGKTKPIGSHKHFEEVWPGTVSTMKGTAKFIQKIKILKANPKVEVDIYFQECSEVTGMCMPPFEQKYELKGLTVLAMNEGETQDTKAAINSTSKLDSNALVNNDNENNTATKTITDTGNTVVNTDENLEDKIKNSGLLALFLLSFGFGLTALATPCVYPMIPMTVSFFTKKSATKIEGIFKGLTFGGSIIFIYTVIGLVVSVLFGENAGNIISTHWLPNLLFFAIFFVFGISFLGLFEITLPSGFVNSIDKKSSLGSFGGIFFMAFTLTLVSFSCTGPIAGAVLGQAATNGEFLRPIVAMFGFSLAFALPFTLFAIFPSWLQNLPKSGSWLNSVKVVLGFVELAFAFKFFSNADVVYHWRILDREIYLAIWIVLAILLGMYLLGKIKFSHDSDMPYVGVPRFLLACVSFCFAVYMVPGLFGAPLKGLSGLLPPMQTQDFVLNTNNDHPTIQQSINSKPKTKHSDFLHLPHGLTGYYDYKEGLAASKATGKPIFVDFTGHACVNCRKMEEYVWAKPEVLKRLQNDFIIVSLYVDEKKELPENEWYTSARDGKVKKTIAQQNSDLQITKYHFSAQPQYIVIDGSEKQLSGPRFYDTDEAAFVQFLDNGKAAFGK
jgi:thiol:disulfide interchange protein DsbD